MRTNDTPRVTELPLVLEPVTMDPFVADLPRCSTPSGRRSRSIGRRSHRGGAPVRPRGATAGRPGGGSADPVARLSLDPPMIRG
jgi:hypothetical protein